MRTVLIGITGFTTPLQGHSNFPNAPPLRSAKPPPHAGPAAAAKLRMPSTIRISVLPLLHPARISLIQTAHLTLLRKKHPSINRPNHNPARTKVVLPVPAAPARPPTPWPGQGVGSRHFYLPDSGFSDAIDPTPIQPHKPDAQHRDRARLGHDHLRRQGQIDDPRPGGAA